MASGSLKSTKRVHGMRAPYHPLQIITWVIYPLLIVQFFCLVFPLLNSLVVRIVTSIVFGVSAIAALVTGGLTATIDPADDACLGAEDENATCPRVLCYLCETYVENTSKHCRTCGKCVQNFDHHCKWLNTCVGKKNYKFFLALMGSVAVMTTLSLGLIAYLLALCFLDKHSVQDRIEDSFLLDGILDYWVVVSLLIVSAVVLLPLVALLYQLMGFHAMLVKRGITTYDYIVAEQKRLREKKKQKVAATTRTPARTAALPEPSAATKEAELVQAYSKAKSEEDCVEDSDCDNAPGAYTHVPVQPSRDEPSGGRSESPVGACSEQGTGGDLATQAMVIKLENDGDAEGETI